MWSASGSHALVRLPMGLRAVAGVGALLRERLLTPGEFAGPVGQAAASIATTSGGISMRVGRSGPLTNVNKHLTRATARLRAFAAQADAENGEPPAREPTGR